MWSGRCVKPCFGRAAITSLLKHICPSTTTVQRPRWRVLPPVHGNEALGKNIRVPTTAAFPPIVDYDYVDPDHDYRDETSYVDEKWVLVAIPPQLTGLPMYVCATPNFCVSLDVPYVRVSKLYYGITKYFDWDQLFTMTIEDEPPKVVGCESCGFISEQDLKLVAAWISLNRELLLRHWRQDEGDMMEGGMVDCFVVWQSVKRI